MQIVWAGPNNSPEANEAIGNWVSFQIWRRPHSFGGFSSMGVMRDGRPIGGIVFHNWDPDAQVIEMSGAATDRKWLSRSVLGAMFGYPFDQLGCQLVAMQVSAAERQSHLHRMLKVYGFKETRIPRLGGRDEDKFIFTLTDDDWRANRFNRKQDHGQKRT